MTEQEIFRTFVSKWAASSDAVTELALGKAEAMLASPFPAAYRRFVTQHGTPYCPALLGAIVDAEADLEDVQQFLPPQEIPQATADYEAAGMTPGFVGFATDSAGNMFLFSTDDCQAKRSDVAVWFFDHDLVEIEQVADSFVEWLQKYIALDPTGAQLTQ